MATFGAPSPGNFDPPEIRVNDKSVETRTENIAISNRYRNFVPVRDVRQDHGVQRLGNLLRKGAITHVDRNIKKFWSSQILKKIMTLDRICGELEACRKRHRFEIGIGKLAHVIQSEYLRVFAILALLDKSRHIEDFIKEGVRDAILPLNEYPTDDGDHFLCRTDLAVETQVKCCHDSEWRTADRENFGTYQYSLNPVIFEMNPDRRSFEHKILDFREVLPFMDKFEPEQGGYGIVSKVKIHADCHGFKGVLPSIKTDNLFAQKESTGTTKKERDADFEKEVSNLKRFNGFFHDHLVTLLMTWTVEDKNYLLFPMANCDLDRYWDEHPDPVKDTKTLQWISKQILGMTNAIEKVHNPPNTTLVVPEQQGYGRHGDLKPENILWYDSPGDEKGILIIADLGLTSFNSIFSRSNVSNGRVHCSPRYKPPELDLEGGKVSRSYDIWTFGCVLLEFVCWALGGQDARSKFLNDLIQPYVTGSCSDKFFDIKTTEGGGFVVLVKDEVSRWIAKLHNHPRCSQYFHDLLDLIQDEMIVCLSAEKNRITSPDLQKRIEQMHEKVMNDVARYVEKRKREPRPVKSALPVEAKFKSDMLRVVQHKNLSTHTGRSQKTKTAEQLARMGIR